MTSPFVWNQVEINKRCYVQQASSPRNFFVILSVRSNSEEPRLVSVNLSINQTKNLIEVLQKLVRQRADPRKGAKQRYLKKRQALMSRLRERGVEIRNYSYSLEFLNKLLEQTEEEKNEDSTAVR